MNGNQTPRNNRAGRNKRSIPGIALLLLAAAPAAEAQPVQGPADTLQLLAAAGMSVSGGRVLNPCQRATEPKVKFIDLNGDGRPEAVTLDQDPACYGPNPGLQSKLLVRGASGRWEVIAVMLGAFKPLSTRSYGWADFTLEGPGCQPVYHFNRRMYVATGCGVASAPWQAPHNQGVAATPAPMEPGPDDNLRLFPATYGRFAPRGDCARLPRVMVSAKAIQIETASGAADFARPGLITNYGGPQDEAITYFLQGGGEGLIVSIKGNALSTSGGEHLGAAERAVAAVADNTPLLRCRPR